MPSPRLQPSAIVPPEIPCTIRTNARIPLPIHIHQRYQGFGRESKTRSCSHDIPSFFLIIHFTWPYLTHSDRSIILEVHKAFPLYAQLRYDATFTDISFLKNQRPAPSDRPIDEARTHAMAVALFRADFDYPNLIRWLGGPYTNAHRDWDETFELIEAIQGTQPRPGDPYIDYDRAFRICTEGAPLTAHYEYKYIDVSRRNMQQPSKPLLEQAHQVDEKLRKEEQLSYHVLLPRFIWRFIYGITLCLFQLAFRYGDPVGRLCVDPSTPLHPEDTANTNQQIPDTGLPESLDENPPIYYGTALIRYLTWIWNLRISYPNEDILQLADDISAAFHRILYHPAIAIAFASVWRNLLVIPVGTIFGAKNSPSNYMLLGELRAFYAQHMPDSHCKSKTDLTARVTLEPEPPLEERKAFAKAVEGKHITLLVTFLSRWLVDANLGTYCLRFRYLVTNRVKRILKRMQAL